ncbi:MAG TPA: 16S rRNA (guanine(527)-N(7))-methyltransferase RsmG [Rhodospirillales bacterium]|nr:16S rRNA (guanine(527)-N(7))-methyltransferase RsmG [Rhodospirillales bacterium]
MKQPLDADGFARATAATPQQVERLSAYLELLNRWQRRINLVGAATLIDPWRRHFLDSAQLVPLLPAATRHLVDLGSGAGFPGMVVALLADIDVTLVEADARKCAFLSEVARLTQAAVRILPQRIEAAPQPRADVVTARALSPLSKLLDYAVPWLAAGGVCLFPKGRSAAIELTEAAKTWKMRTATIPSRSDPDAMILRIDEISKHR